MLNLACWRSTVCKSVQKGLTLPYQIVWGGFEVSLRISNPSFCFYLQLCISYSIQISLLIHAKPLKSLRCFQTCIFPTALMPLLNISIKIRSRGVISALLCRIRELFYLVEHKKWSLNSKPVTSPLICWAHCGINEHKSLCTRGHRAESRLLPLDVCSIIKQAVRAIYPMISLIRSLCFNTHTLWSSETVEVVFL